MVARKIAAFFGCISLSQALQGPFTQELSDTNPTSANCTWKWFDQPLNHFAGAGDSKFTFKQRTCFYDGFWQDVATPTAASKKPTAVLFYVGNESPLEVYVNNTGMMWNLASEIGAGIIFAEHRYEGESVPLVLNGTRNCMQYVSSKQALADYALLIETLKYTSPYSAIYRDVPFIAFGGSYGGMLASWIRTKYPHLIAGALAGSAPIYGIPMVNPGYPGFGRNARVASTTASQISSDPTTTPVSGVNLSPKSNRMSFNSLLDSSALFVSRSLTQAGGLQDSTCMLNYKAFWVLLKYVLEQYKNTSLNSRLATAMKLCDAPKVLKASNGSLEDKMLQDQLQDQGLEEVNVTVADSTKTDASPRLPKMETITVVEPTDFSLLSNFMQQAFFLLAEGNYPFPSDYITGAVGGNMKVKLPAWPMRHTCGPMQNLGRVSTFFESNTHTTSSSPYVNREAPLIPPSFSIEFGNLRLKIDGANVTHVAGLLDEELFLKLATTAAEGISVWYNVTQTVSCLDWKNIQSDDSTQAVFTPGVVTTSPTPSDESRVEDKRSSNAWNLSLWDRLFGKVNEAPGRKLTLKSPIEYKSISSTSSLTRQTPPRVTKPAGKASEKLSALAALESTLSSGRKEVFLSQNVGSPTASSTKATYQTTTLSPRADDSVALIPGAAVLYGDENSDDTKSDICVYPADNRVLPAFSWGPTVCNDQMFLVNTDSQGYGRDLFFPPTGPPSLDSMYGPQLSLIQESEILKSECAVQSDAINLFGLTDRADPYGQELYDYYGLGASRIIFSNGLLDPWSGGGVGVPGNIDYPSDATSSPFFTLDADTLYPDPSLEVHSAEYLEKVFYPLSYDRYISNDSREVFAAIIPHGAHHLDLMFPSANDPEDVKVVRAEEVRWIKKWIGIHNDQFDNNAELLVVN